MFSSEAAIALKGVGAVIYREMRLFFGNKATIVLSVMTRSSTCSCFPLR